MPNFFAVGTGILYAQEADLVECFFGRARTVFCVKALTAWLDGGSPGIGNYFYE